MGDASRKGSGSDGKTCEHRGPLKPKAWAAVLATKMEANEFINDRAAMLPDEYGDNATWQGFSLPSSWSEEDSSAFYYFENKMTACAGKDGEYGTN